MKKRPLPAPLPALMPPADRAGRRPAPALRPVADLLAEGLRVGGDFATRAEMAHLAGLVRDRGDRDAYSALALAVRPFVRFKAKHYAAKYAVDAEDLESVGWLALSRAVRWFDPAGGRNGFFNYFAFACARSMNTAAAATRAQLDRERPTPDDHLRDHAAGGPSADVLRLRDALADLPRRDRQLLQRVHGLLSGRRMSVRAAGESVGYSAETASARYRKLKAALRDHVAR